MKIEARGIQMSYQLSGQGPPLVLIHGFSDNLSMWYNQAPVFAKRHRVLAYDVRGHGGTETPPGDFSMKGFAEDLRALLGALEIERACVLGYSMGGRIGLEFALQYPEATAGLVFANSGIMGSDVQLPPERLAEMAEMRQQMLKMLETGDIEVIADTMAERSLSPGFRTREPAVFRRYKEVKLRNDPRHYLAIMGAMIEAMSRPPDLTQLRCPALIIAGDRDGFMAVDVARSMERAIPDVSLTMLPTGHAAAIEAPDPFNRAVLDFTSRLW